MRSCVNLFSRLFEQPEEYVACYLDMYYQLRRAEEIAENPDFEMIGPLRLGAAIQTAPGTFGTTKEDNPPVTAQAPRQPPLGKGAGETEKPKGPSPMAKYKQKIIDRIQTARAAGVTYAKIAVAGGDRVTETLVVNALNAGQIKLKEWQALEKALDMVEGESPTR